MSIFKVENLTYYYPETEQPALCEINLEVAEGEFLLVVGGSGSGKSSLARALAGLIPDFYGGKVGGRMLFKGSDAREIDRRRLAAEVGIVFQDPEKQLVMTGVEAEIAFGLENIGLPQQEMFRRIAEVMSFLNLMPFKSEFTANLSGGQKQKLALASVLAMQPCVLVLDEPTSQLDPAAAEELFNLVKRLNEEMNLTIILIEQRLERCFHLADRVVVMANGRIVNAGAPEEMTAWQVKSRMPFVPPVAALFAHLESPVLPLTVKDGRKLIRERFYPTFNTHNTRWVVKPAKGLDSKKNFAGSAGDNELVRIKDLWFSYPNGREALRGINLGVMAGEFLAVLGENAAGKTTLLKHLVGLLKPGRGVARVCGIDTRQSMPQQLARVVGYLSQNPSDYLFQDTVEAELRFTLTNLGISDDGRINRLLVKLGLDRYRQVNPRDLSSGERQRVALASVLVAGPQLLVLDEPTRGIDYQLKGELGNLLQELILEGVAVVLVTHDVEFAAEYAGRVIMLFDGQIACDGPKYAVLNDSMFYAPQISRLFRDMDGSVLTLREALDKLRKVRKEVAGCPIA